jgi:hypothetical protein
VFSDDPVLWQARVEERWCGCKHVSDSTVIRGFLQGRKQAGMPEMPTSHGVAWVRIKRQARNVPKGDESENSKTGVIDQYLPSRQHHEVRLPELSLCTKHGQSCLK